ncbi:DUF5610 domain-containing protein [Rhodocyclus tenuis]|uniref:DUF5610 domain-containing protein n=1 Tax=Rhodocyclus tenuis TaxID=1066 RepID=A0A840GH55_RHOTE|nr:DUF5610 domain-containing protein [Rhodocyclus tenuis]MBB4247509.1 hypothetical protein [Rhodocyclus tenuis]MBK1679590.1 hypothetical protein [Rhodocyclus tenuis]
MSNSIASTPSAPRLPAATPAAAAEAKRNSAGTADAATAQASARAQLNQSIMQASLEVSISVQNSPLSLLFRSAIDSLNEALAPELGADAIQNAASQDNTPAATAGRIVSLSTGFFAAFKQNHPGEDDASVLKNFMDTIRGGFEKGFKEATDILTGLQVFNGDIASNIGKTYALVQQGYADFEAAQGAAPGTPASATARAA